MDHQTIELAYKLILGREPESQEVVEKKAQSLHSIEEVRNEFINSDEFRINNVSKQTIRDFLIHQYRCHYLPIEVECPISQLNALFSRVKVQWSKLGETEPYWSVLTTDKFKLENIEKEMEGFYKSGKSDADLISVFAERNLVDVPNGACLELGCGVGRITRFLANRFNRVTAVDVSKGNLDIAQKYLDEHGIENVDYLLCKEPDDINRLANYDIFVSFIVLQHNPPPLQFFMLEKILQHINRNGLCLFQTITYFEKYNFSIDRYLASIDPVFEMHCLPQKYVFNILQKNNFKILEVTQDYWAGEIIRSHTYFAIKEPLDTVQHAHVSVR